MQPAEEVSVAPGDVLAGKYRVLRQIGKGGMGVVVEAMNEQLAERVAIKVLHDRYRENEEAMARFHHEARAAVRVRGEHSVRLLDVGDTPSGAPFLVMELLEGLDLATVLRQGQLPIERAVLYILEAAVGVAEVHANGIIHRDIKPGNLFLTHRSDATPLVKVLDFGIAKSVLPEESNAHVTMTLVALGTPLYMSPEQVRSARNVDGRTDIWSLGAILYELIAGIPAFGGNTVSNITAQILEATPGSLTLLRAGVPPKLDKIVLKALAKKAEHRYADVAELAAALAPFAEDRGAQLAQRAAKTLRGEGRAMVAGSISAMTSVAPGATTTIETEAMTTHRFVRSRTRGVIFAALAAFAIVTAVAGWSAVHVASGRVALGAAAQKGIGERAAVAGAIVRTAARLSPTSPPASAGARSEPAFEPSELPDVDAKRSAADPKKPDAPANNARPPVKHWAPRDDDPLATRR